MVVMGVQDGRGKRQAMTSPSAVNSCDSLVSRSAICGQKINAFNPDPVSFWGLFTHGMVEMQADRHDLFIFSWQLQLLNVNVYCKERCSNQRILLVLTYSSEMWHLTRNLEMYLKFTQRRMERIQVDITWRGRKQASWLRNRETDDILMVFENMKWTWAGCITIKIYGQPK